MSYEELLKWLELHPNERTTLKNALKKIKNFKNMSKAAQKRLRGLIRKTFHLRDYRYRFVRIKKAAFKKFKRVKRTRGKDGKMYYFRKKRFMIEAPAKKRGRPIKRIPIKVKG